MTVSLSSSSSLLKLRHISRRKLRTSRGKFGNFKFVCQARTWETLCHPMLKRAAGLERPLLLTWKGKDWIELLWKTLNNNDLNQVTDQRFSLNNGSLHVLIFPGSEKLILAFCYLRNFHFWSQETAAILVRALCCETSGCKKISIKRR